MGPPDGITAELLKGAEKPVSEALHKVITNVWSTGRVPADGKKALSSHSTRAKDRTLSAVATGRFLFCLQCIGKSICTYPFGAHSAST